MDYLSAIQLGIIASDGLVLNSVSNMEKAVKALQGYERIECFLDTMMMRGERPFKDCKSVSGRKSSTVPLCMPTTRI